MVDNTEFHKLEKPKKSVVSMSLTREYIDIIRKDLKKKKLDVSISAIVDEYLKKVVEYIQKGEEQKGEGDTEKSIS